MKRLFVAGAICACWLSIAVAEGPATVANAQFVAQVKDAVATAQDKNPQAVELLGWGSASLLDSHRASKIRCGKGNRNPKPGECSDAFPIYPDAKPLATVIANEQGAKVETTATEAVWVAWRDLNGFNIAFNSPRIGDYELSTVTEVEQDGRWTAIRIYTVTVKHEENGWIDGPKIGNAGFTRLTLGDAACGVAERLEALMEIGVLASVELNPEVAKAIAAGAAAAEFHE